MTTLPTLRIGFVIFDGMQALDLFGPLDALNEANDQSARGAPCYETVVLSETGAPALTSSGVRIEAHAAVRDAPALDTLLVPGGGGARRADVSRALIDWIGAADRTTRRTGSICTGLFLLAQTGVLDGRRVTTHWRRVEDARARFPTLRIDPDAIFVGDGKYVTAAGVTAGVDLALALIEADYGPGLANAVARELVVFLKRPGDQRQFSTPLREQVRARDAFAELVAWITDHLDEDLSAFALAERTGLSERQFRRRFARTMGETPVKFVERMRMDAAQARLVEGAAPVDVIARQTGFASADVFRRAFERAFGVTPSDYRARFSRAGADAAASDPETRR